MLKANGGTLVINSHDLVVGTGSMLITGGGKLQLWAQQEQQAINFSGSGSLDLRAAYQGVISGFAVGDTIDLSYVAASFNFGTGVSNIQANWVQNTANQGTLTIVDPTLPVQIGTLATLTLNGQYSPLTSHFVVSDDGSLHPLISLSGPLAPPPPPPTQFMLFNGPSADLWLSDGTAAGTHDLGTIANASSGGLNPIDLTVFHGEFLFNGTNANNIHGLWVTDGTAAGTHELTGIAGANPQGLDPRYMTVYGNKVLFRAEAGVAGNQVPGLWVTDGTAAGTFEIGGVANIGISNASKLGLLPSDPGFTVFQGKVLFSGRDSANNQGLWVTDGTAAGTFELAPIAGAFKVGSPGSDVLGSGPDMAVLNNKVLFKGTDLQNTPGSLWVTDGTAAGTFEIGGQGNAAIVGSPNGFTGQFTSELPHGIQPRDLTTFNGKVLFAGQDNTLRPNGFYANTDGLWISDGTAAGTFEIGGIGNAGIAGANSAVNGGIFWHQSIAFPDFTVFNNKAFFVGYDATQHVSLWQTDGTAAGTTEIGGLGNAGIANISPGGLLHNTVDPEFTVFNNQLYFHGVNASGKDGLWVTDGTAAHTHEVVGLGSLYPIDLTALSIANVNVSQALTNNSQSALFITDSFANVSANLDALANISSSIMSIALTDSTVPNLTLSGSQYINDLSVILAISTAYNLQINLSVAFNNISAPVNSPINGAGGADIINGANHHDIVTFSRPSTDYLISPISGGVSVSAPGSPTYVLHNVEDLQFTDRSIFVENADNANIARLYSAALGRSPDTGGLFGWEDIYANNISPAAKAGGVYLSLAQTDDGFGSSIAGGFAQSVEFRSKYGNLDDAGFVRQLYLNVLDRTPSGPELNAWLDLMHDSNFTRDMVLVGFAESPENIAKTAGWLIQV